MKKKGQGLRESISKKKLNEAAFAKDNALVRQMGDDSRYLFGEYEKARR
jgi:hypothetical protein